MKVKTYVVSHFQTNCYLGYSENDKDCFIVDPGAKSLQLVDDVAALGLAPKYLILTHGHGDHTGGVDFIKEKYPDIQLVAGINEKDFLYDARKSFGQGKILPDILVNDGDVLECGDMELKIIATPGHTPGGICILSEGILFSGDTLFRGSIGRTDFYGGDYGLIIKSLHKLMELPGDTVVMPGHMGSSTIEYEKRHNPFV
ncbi:MAG: MBL fold metallo-hydrolase [Clostridiales bacterium]|nr:MBL fold metallo-hydrolase [Clostridiales bacterium]